MCISIDSRVCLQLNSAQRQTVEENACILGSFTRSPKASEDACVELLKKYPDRCVGSRVTPTRSFDVMHFCAAV